MRRAAAMLAVLTALWAVDAALGLGVFWTHDLRHHHVPWRVWAGSEWLSGRVPLWAPGVANGYPLMADGQAGVLYAPTMVLFALLPPAWAVNLALLGHTFWAGLGTHGLLKRLGRSDTAALFGAVAFAFSGFLATHALYLGMHDAVAWVPWLLWAVLARRWGRAGLAALALLLAGHVQAAAIGLLLVGVVAVHAEWTSRRRLPWAFAGAMVLALLAASPQLLATWELVGFSLRDGGVSGAFANIGSLPPQELVNGVLPRFFGFDRPGDITQTYYHRGTGYWGAGENHWEMAFYLGIPVLALGLAGLRGRRLWWGIALGAVALMLDGNTPIWPLVRHLPGLGGFRFPVRFSLALTLAAAVLAASGLDAVLAWPAARAGAWGRGMVLLSALFVGGMGAAHLAIGVGEPLVRARLEGHFLAQVDMPTPPGDLPPLLRAALPDPEPEDPALVPAKVDRIVASLARSTAPWSALVWGPALLLTLLGAALWKRERLGGRALGALCVLLLYADLWSFGAGYQVRVPRSLLDRQPAALPIIRAEGGRVRTTVVDRRQDPALDIDLISASLGLVYGTRDVIITSPLLLVRNEALLGLVGLDVGDRGLVKVERLARWPALVDLLGVRWLLSVHDLGPAGYPRFDDGEGEVGLYRNADPLPGAFLVGCARTTTDPWADLQAIDPRQEAIVEGAAPGACAPGPAGEATIIRDDPQSIDIAVKADRPALLVQNDSWYPGWVATVDGQPAALLRTDLLFRGVAVPAGEHVVSLRYRPPLLRTSLLVAPLAVLGLALLGVRRRPHAASGAGPPSSRTPAASS